MYKNLYKKSIFYILNISILIINVCAQEINPKKEYVFKQYFSQINWEKVNDKREKALKWEIYKNKKPINYENDLKNNKLDIKNKKISNSSSFLISKGEKILDYGFINDNSNFYILKLGLSKAFNIDFSSELISTKNKNNNPNRIKNTFLEKGVRNLRGGAILQIFSQTRGDFITTNLRLSYGEKTGGLKAGYVFSEIINKYLISDWLSFYINPKYTYTYLGNICSISSSFKWRLNPKFELIPQTNINLYQAENNFSITGRTYLSKNIIIDTFVSNSLGIIDMGKQFKSESTKYGMNIRLRF